VPPVPPRTPPNHTLSKRKKRPTPASRRPPRSELSLLLGLAYDLLRAPVFLVLLLLGKADKRLALTPFFRVCDFVWSAKATTALLFTNVACFAVERLLKTRLPAQDVLALFAFSPETLWKGRFLPLVLHVFAHADGMHLLSNMVPLFVFGRVVEGLVGPGRLLLSYGLSAACATLVSLLAQGVSGQYVPTLGASGAVAGLIALGVLLAPLTVTFEALLPLPLFLLGWLSMAADVWALGSRASDAVDHPAHLGGYLSSVLLIRLLPSKLKARAAAGFWFNLLTLAFAALLFWFARKP